jgi:uncharacterized protein
MGSFTAREKLNRAMRVAVLALLRAYKWALSPLFPPTCRYVPSCSEYAMEAIDRYGIVRGGWMAAGRLLRCHPFVKGGFDPVSREEKAPSRAGATDLQGLTRIGINGRASN